MNKQPLTDTCPMPHGKHKGTAMQDVPASYLIWYDREATYKAPEVIAYIDDNRDVLQIELKKQSRR